MNFKEYYHSWICVYLRFEENGCRTWYYPNTENCDL